MHTLFKRLLRGCFAITVLVLLIPGIASAAPTFVGKWGVAGAGTGQFSDPIGIASDGLGHVFVAERDGHRIQEFTATGTFVRAWGSSGTANGQFDSLYDVDVDRYGYVFVPDGANDRVQVFTSAGVYVGQWGSHGSGDGQFDFAEALSVDPAGEHVYVTDGGNGRVQKFTRDGQFVTKWGSQGSGNGQFEDPHGILADGSGHVYVTDGRLQKFTSTGTWLATITLPENDAVNVALNNRGLLCVTGWASGRVYRYSATGTLYDSFATPGGGDGQLFHPIGLDIQGRYIHVADAGNNRIAYWRDDLPKLTTRFAGSNRYAVAVNAAKNLWGPTLAGVHDVVIVCGEDRAMCDALSAGPLAGAYGAPLLLTASASLPNDTKNALSLIRATNGPLAIHVLGGTGSVSTATYNAIASRNPGGTIERIAGSDRYVLSANIARRFDAVAAAKGTPYGGVLIFNAESTSAFYDALAASSVAVREWYPMLAVRKYAVPNAVRRALATTFVGKTRFVASGTPWISSTVYSQVRGSARFASSGDRATAATQIAAFARSRGWLLYENVGLATMLPDSLSGGLCMGLKDGVLLYTNPRSFPTVTRNFLGATKYGSMRGYLFGGTGSISSGVATSFYSALNTP